MTKKPTDLTASVAALLKNLARSNGEDFQLVLLRYANERLLYRLERSEHASRFVLKGAALFMVWTGRPHRATRDLDLLGFGESGEEDLRKIFAEVLAIHVADDGVRYDLDSLAAGPIREDDRYGGVRLKLVANIGSAKVAMQIDVGFGDAITPSDPPIITVPALLSFPAPRIRAYPRETVVAEKLQAMVSLGMANSRMKDFYDLRELGKRFAFEGGLLVRAIQATFARRGTALPTAVPVALTSAFSEDTSKKSQWAAFRRKSGAPDAGELGETIAALVDFAQPPLEAAARDAPFASRWRAGGSWQ